MTFTPETVRAVLLTEIGSWLKQTLDVGRVGTRTFSHGRQWNFYMRVQSGLPYGIGEELCLVFANVSLSGRLQRQGILSSVVRHFHDTLDACVVIEQIHNPYLERWAKKNMLYAPIDVQHSTYYLPRSQSQPASILVNTDSEDPGHIYANTYLSRPLVDEYIRANNIQLLQDVMQHIQDTPDRLTLQRAVGQMLLQHQAYNPATQTNH